MARLRVGDLEGAWLGTLEGLQFVAGKELEIRL